MRDEEDEEHQKWQQLLRLLDSLLTRGQQDLQCSLGELPEDLQEGGPAEGQDIEDGGYSMLIELARSKSAMVDAIDELTLTQSTGSIRRETDIISRRTTEEKD